MALNKEITRHLCTYNNWIEEHEKERKKGRKRERERERESKLVTF